MNLRKNFHLTDFLITQFLQLLRTCSVWRRGQNGIFTVLDFAGNHSDERLAIVITKDGVIERIYKNPTVFPRIAVDSGEPVPKRTLFHRANGAQGWASGIEEAASEQWLETEWGKSVPVLYEQVFLQQDGYAMIMLWAEAQENEDEDEDDNRTSAERYRHRTTKWNER